MIYFLHYLHIKQIYNKTTIQMPNVIYIVHCDNNDFFKLGMSTDFDNRIQQYKTSHWVVQTLRKYTIPKYIKLREIERATHSFV